MAGLDSFVRRSLRTRVVLDHTKEMVDEEILLRATALVCTVSGTRPFLAPGNIGEALLTDFPELPRGSFQVSLMMPGAFFIRFTEARWQELVAAQPVFHYHGTPILTRRWTRLTFTSFRKYRYSVRLYLERLSPQAWSLDTVQRALPGCLIHTVAGETVTKQDLSYYVLEAWVENLEDVPMEAVIDIHEPRPCTDPLSHVELASGFIEADDAANLATRCDHQLFNVCPPRLLSHTVLVHLDSSTYIRPAPAARNRWTSRDDDGYDDGDDDTTLHEERTHHWAHAVPDDVWLQRLETAASGSGQAQHRPRRQGTGGRRRALAPPGFETVPLATAAVALMPVSGSVGQGNPAASPEPPRVEPQFEDQLDSVSALAHTLPSALQHCSAGELAMPAVPSPVRCEDLRPSLLGAGARTSQRPLSPRAIRLAVGTQSAPVPAAGPDKSCAATAPQRPTVVNFSMLQATPVLELAVPPPEQLVSPDTGAIGTLRCSTSSAKDVLLQQLVPAASRMPSLPMQIAPTLQPGEALAPVVVRVDTLDAISYAPDAPCNERPAAGALAHEAVALAQEDAAQPTTVEGLLSQIQQPITPGLVPLDRSPSTPPTRPRRTRGKAATATAMRRSHRIGNRKAEITGGGNHTMRLARKLIVSKRGLAIAERGEESEDEVLGKYREAFDAPLSPDQMKALTTLAKGACRRDRSAGVQPHAKLVAPAK
jgi:hypothetical protein